MKKEMKDGDPNYVWLSKKWLEDQAQGQTGTKFETVFVQNLHSIRFQRGLIHCNFIVPKCLSDKDGNWHVGAIATLIDIVGFAATLSSVGSSLASVDFNVSYFSTAKIDVFWVLYLRRARLKDMHLMWSSGGGGDSLDFPKIA